MAFRKLEMEELGRPDVESFQHQTKLPIVLVLENIRSMLNVGSIFRTADGMGIEKLILIGITACPPHREIAKTALGAELSIPFEYFEDSNSALEYLKAEGYTLLALEQTTEAIELQDFQPKEGEKLAIILGNEAFGVEEETLQQCDQAIIIPQWGTKHSFNVTVAAGICLWEVVRKCRNLN